jgi:hypothetical protein
MTVVPDRDRHRRELHKRRTPAERARVLTERLAEVAAMRQAGQLPDHPRHDQKEPR